MANIILIGGQWGDEGKGKVVDLLTPRFDIVGRYSGGPNAGHTVRRGDANIGCEDRADETLFGVLALLRWSYASDLPAGNSIRPMLQRKVLAAICRLEIRWHCARVRLQRACAQPCAHELLGDTGDVARGRRWRLQGHRIARDNFRAGIV